MRRLLRALEGLFFLVAVLGVLLISASSGYIATSWLKVEKLSLVEVQGAVVVMSFIIALRWMSGLYRGTITGFEELAWLGAWNAGVATLRFVIIVPFFMMGATTPLYFFAYQLIVALVEIVGLSVKSYRLLPVGAGRSSRWEWDPIRDVVKFSMGIAFVSSVWVLATQMDKLVLSRVLTLSDYGHFTLAVLIAAGVTTISGPVSGALMPRMTRLHAERDDSGLLQLYRQGTEIVAVIGVPAGLVLACFSQQVLWAWTGDHVLAERAAPVLSLYALGNGVLSVAAFPYYLQFAKGDLRLHVIGNALLFLVLTPSLIWAAQRYGAKGAGWTWLITNAVYFVAWIPLVHRRLARGLHMPWLGAVAAIAGPASIACLGMKSLLSWPSSRLGVSLMIGVVSLVALFASGMGSGWLRMRVLSWFRSRKASASIPGG